MGQAALFPEIIPANPAGGISSRPMSGRALPVLGEQKDIRYYDAPARGVLNGPEATGMGYWSINPYVGCAFGCAYCYARYAHRYASERHVAAAPDDPFAADVRELPPWLAFERRVLVKQDAPAVLRRELDRLHAKGAGRGRGLIEGETIVLGTATDPYQPAERRFRVTRGILEVLAEWRGLSLVIITKSPLVTRDVDVLTRIAARSALTVHVSLVTLDRGLARRIEPRAPTPEARLRAVAGLAEAGIDVGVNVMPVLPGITDDVPALEALIRRVAVAGASHVNAGALRLRREARERYLPLIARDFPHLAARYQAAYADGHEAGTRYRAGLRRVVSRLCREAGIGFGGPDSDGERVTTGWRGRDARDAPGSLAADIAGDAAGAGPQLAFAL